MDGFEVNFVNIIMVGNLSFLSKGLLHVHGHCDGYTNWSVFDHHMWGLPETFLLKLHTTSLSFFFLCLVRWLAGRDSLAENLLKALKLALRYWIALVK